MTEYIGCRKCDSPDCKGCNLKNLETMLNNVKFDCLMNGNRCINPSADVALVRHGRWDNIPNTYMSVASKNGSYSGNATSCSICRKINPNLYKTNYCPNCGAKMDLEEE